MSPGDVSYEMIGKGNKYQIFIYYQEKKIGKAYLELCNNPSILEISYVEIHLNYQEKGFGKELYRIIAEVYRWFFTGKKMKWDFHHINAYFLARRAVETGLFPKESWDKRYIDYSDEVRSQLENYKALAL